MKPTHIVQGCHFTSEVFTFTFLCQSSALGINKQRRGIAAVTHFIVSSALSSLEQGGSYMEDFFCQLTSSLIGGDVEQDHLGQRQERDKRRLWRGNMKSL